MMNVLADRQIELSYLRDPLSIEALDHDEIIDDLIGGLAGTGASYDFGRLRLTDYDHLMIATDLREGRVVALIGALDSQTFLEEYLLIDVAFARPDARDSMLLQRMMAAMLLRIAGLGAMPTAIAACTSDPGWLHTLHAFGRRFTGSAFFPQPQDSPVQLRSAALAQRIAKTLHPSLRFQPSTGAIRGALAMRTAAHSFPTASARSPDADHSCLSSLASMDQLLVLIDLRAQGEAAIIEDARKLYRGRRAARSSQPGCDRRAMCSSLRALPAEDPTQYDTTDVAMVARAPSSRLTTCSL